MFGEYGEQMKNSNQSPLANSVNELNCMHFVGNYDAVTKSFLLEI